MTDTAIQEATMRRFATTTIAGILFVTASLTLATPARAGEFHVATCQADRLNYSTAAFGDFATRGMKIRRACNPEGLGLRGLVTSNVIRQSAIPRGAVAMVAINAPAGTTFTTFRWAGSARRVDCRYALQLYADAPDAKTVPVKNVRANRGCPPSRRVQRAAYQSRTFDVRGTTRIVQRVACVGGQGRKSCSARAANYIRTYQAEVGIVDSQPPAAAVLPDTALARGEWVRGEQPLAYTATDNVGVRSAQPIAGGQPGGSHQRDCQVASPEGAFAQVIPCPNGAARFTVDTKAFPEGTQALTVQAQDTAGNAGTSAAVPVHVDNTAPPRVETAAEGGEGWRNANSFALSWSNAGESDRAPIAAATYKLCPAPGGSCTTAEQTAASIERIALQVPSPGEWTVSMWRRDAAGNETADAASVPVRLRFDPDAPRLGFEATQASDPTRVAVTVSDAVSGVAGGSIELSRQGSNTWQALATERDGDRLVARLDDTSLPAGPYLLRARAVDQARNESSTDRRVDGQPMVVTLPLRIGSVMRGGVAFTKTVERGGKRRRVPAVKPLARVRLGQRVQVSGQLTNRDGQGIGGAEIKVLSRSPIAAEQLVGVLRTREDGRFGYSVAGSTNRTLSFRYAGSPLILPAGSEVKLAVPASTSLDVSRRRVLNGRAVRFRGRLRTLPMPAQGKLVELQVMLPSGWQTFRTTRTDAAGRWTLPYKFQRTRGVRSFRFRARLPSETGYPFVTGRSRSLIVRVRGQ